MRPQHPRAWLSLDGKSRSSLGSRKASSDLLAPSLLSPHLGLQLPKEHSPPGPRAVEYYCYFAEGFLFVRAGAWSCWLYCIAGEQTGSVHHGWFEQHRAWWDDHPPRC